MVLTYTYTNYFTALPYINSCINEYKSLKKRGKIHKIEK